MKINDLFAKPNQTCYRSTHLWRASHFIGPSTSSHAQNRPVKTTPTAGIVSRAKSLQLLRALNPRCSHAISPFFKVTDILIIPRIEFQKRVENMSYQLITHMNENEHRGQVTEGGVVRHLPVPDGMTTPMIGAVTRRIIK